MIDKIGVGLVHPIVYVWCLYVSMALLLIPVFHIRRQGLGEVARRHLPHILLIGPGALLTYLIVLYAFRLGPVSYIAALREADNLARGNFTPPRLSYSNDPDGAP